MRKSIVRSVIVAATCLVALVATVTPANAVTHNYTLKMYNSSGHRIATSHGEVKYSTAVHKPNAWVFWNGNKNSSYLVVKFYQYNCLYPYFMCKWRVMKSVETGPAWSSEWHDQRVWGPRLRGKVGVRVVLHEGIWGDRTKQTGIMVVHR